MRLLRKYWFSNSIKLNPNLESTSNWWEVTKIWNFRVKYDPLYETLETNPIDLNFNDTK